MRRNSTQTDETVAAVGGSNSSQQKSSLKARVLDEAKKALITTAYLWVLFATLSLHKTAILQQNHINYVEQGFAIVNALVFAKVMLIAEHLKLGTRFQDKPLIYSVLYTSFAFAIVLICFHIIEGGLLALLHGRPPGEGLADLGAGDLRGVLSYAAIAFVALIPFFLFRGIGHLLGKEQLELLVFAPRRARFTLVQT